jgi:L-rhamnose isomerase
MSRGDITLVGQNGKVHVEIKRLSHEELLLHISSPKYEVSENLVIKNEELRKTLLELMKKHNLSPELICTEDITIATYLLL